MKIILPQVIITDPKSPYNGQKMDIRINNGEIKEISSSIKNKQDYDFKNRDEAKNKKWYFNGCWWSWFTFNINPIFQKIL